MTPEDREHVDVLFVDVLPFRHSTRTRKMALSVANAGHRVNVAAVTLQRVGRVGIEDARPAYEEEGVRVRQVSSPVPLSGASVWSSLYNLLRVYPVGLARLARVAMSVSSPRVVVGSTSLIWLGVLHRLKYRSSLVVNARERLAGVRTKGSLGTLVSRAEPMMVKALAHSWVTVTSVCESHALEFRRAGAREVIVVRNAAQLSFMPSQFLPTPGDGVLTVALVGSLYPGRGIEPLIEAISLLRSAGHHVEARITGRASPAYRRSLVELIASLDVEERVKLLGECGPDEVAERYAQAHLGTALYESVDSANDSLSNKIFECVASGRAVLAGDLPENAKLVADHDLGWTAPVTARGIADSLQSILLGGFDFDFLGKHCLDVARQRLNWEKEFDPVLQLLVENIESQGIDI